MIAAKDTTPPLAPGTRVLVTGADGFIGSHLTERLVREGAKVRAFACYNSFNSAGWLDRIDPKVRAEIEIFPGDIRDPSRVVEAVKNCEMVFHLAALIAIPYSYHAPESYVQTNVLGTLNVLQAARAHGIRRVLHTSTSEVYGTAQFVPITEEHPLQAQSPYAATKIAADQMALSFHRSFDLPVVVVRPFNTYGPRQSARAVIPTIISQLATADAPLRLGALTPTRDFTFATDTAAGFVAAAVADAAIGEVINLGSGFEISINDTVKLIASEMGAAVEMITDEDRVRPARSEVERLFADTEKARKLLGWSSEFGGLDGFRKGLRQTIEWFSDPANLSFYKPTEYNV
ncbi:MAG: NAD-dependent 4,6-dehydratase LegB [Chthoniobacterales bacterium]